MNDALTKLSTDEIIEIKNAFPHIPKEYFDFIRDRGWGKMSNNLMLYSGPVTPDEIYGANYPDTLDKIVIFGDDFNGYCFGWDVHNQFSIIEIDPVDFGFEYIKSNFKEFISSRI